MKRLHITIPGKTKQYPIIIGKNLLEQISVLVKLDNYSKIVIVTDENIEKLLLEKVVNGLTLPAGRQKPFTTNTICIPAGEQYKTIETVRTIWERLHTFGCDRKSLIINLGGGVIGDMGGFAASTYMRGVDFLQIPTSLLAQVDASIGGKTAIDFGDIKNLIGTFQQPLGVLIDITLLQTLPEKEFLNGFAEIIKHGLILDQAYFNLVTSKKPTEFTQDELIDIITKSCEMKVKLVQSDDTENGQRKLLNFGHTIGHAIEAISLETDYPLRHGEAVHIGMIAETKISNQTGLLSDAETKIIIEKLQTSGLPISVKNIAVDAVLHKIQSDKKNVHGQVNWVLLKHIGEAVYDQHVDEKIVRDVLKKIL